MFEWESEKIYNLKTVWKSCYASFSNFFVTSGFSTWITDRWLINAGENNASGWEMWIIAKKRKLILNIRDRVYGTEIYFVAISVICRKIEWKIVILAHF